MFGKAKGSAQEKQEGLQPALQLQDSTSVSSVKADSTEISCIGPGMTVVGKISSEGTLNVLGRVEGELQASIVPISDGAQVEGFQTHAPWATAFVLPISVEFAPP
jgi:hypothetical protein